MHDDKHSTRPNQPCAPLLLARLQPSTGYFHLDCQADLVEGSSPVHENIRVAARAPGCSECVPSYGAKATAAKEGAIDRTHKGHVRPVFAQKVSDCLLYLMLAAMPRTRHVEHGATVMTNEKSVF